MAELYQEFGKIKSADFGYGGYQEAMIVFTLHIGGKGWGSCITYECGWASGPDKWAEWTDEDRIKRTGEKALEVFRLIQKAKKKSLKELEGVPIKAFFDGPNGRIQHIEIFEEVI